MAKYDFTTLKRDQFPAIGCLSAHDHFLKSDPEIDIIYARLTALAQQLIPCAIEGFFKFGEREAGAVTLQVLETIYSNTHRYARGKVGEFARQASEQDKKFDEYTKRADAHPERASESYGINPSPFLVDISKYYEIVAADCWREARSVRYIQESMGQVERASEEAMAAFIGAFKDISGREKSPKRRSRKIGTASDIDRQYLQIARVFATSSADVAPC